MSALPPKAHLMVPRLEGKRIGLVLCGGGAKGAYQVGVWKALREKGVTKFEIIAGTSVGALNAALVANGDIKRAEHVWEQIDTLLRWEPRRLIELMIAYCLLFGPQVISILSLLLGLFSLSFFAATTSLFIGFALRVLAAFRKPF